MLACTLSPAEERKFQQLVQKYKLTEHQRTQYIHYLDLLHKANQEFNLTTVPQGVESIERHLEDSLIAATFIDFSLSKSIADVGTGGGLPGIPLKILYPHISLTLIEVSHKKRTFLEQVIQTLELTDTIVSELDWRTFLRKTDLSIDVFLARASLEPAELLRIYKPSSPFNNAQLLYWASSTWRPTSFEKAYVKKEYPYTIQQKKRRLISFGELKIPLTPSSKERNTVE